MRAITLALTFLLSLPAWADDVLRLYQAAGWPQQRTHFSEALQSAQERYRSSLPPAVFQALVNNSNQRFNPSAVDQRVQQGLRDNLSNPTAALQFFESPLGRKIVSAELTATRRDQLARYANGLPRIEADATRRLQIRHLAQALPASQAGAEVSLALAGIAADSLSQMLPGLLGGDSTHMLLNSQRQRLVEQMNADLDNTLLFVYRDLSDAELEEFVSFVQSPDGQAYYQAALAALRSGLAVGQSAASLAPAPTGI
jgi:hypothetical protein